MRNRRDGTARVHHDWVHIRYKVRMVSSNGCEKVCDPTFQDGEIGKVIVISEGGAMNS
jgi:hypothetical protein